MVSCSGLQDHPVEVRGGLQGVPVLVRRTTPGAVLPRDPGVCKSGRTGTGQNYIIIHYLK